MRNIFISGLYGSSNKGLGLYIESNYTFDQCIYLSEDFMKCSWELQKEIVRKVISQNGSIKLIAVSYGAYILLNCLIDSNHDNIELLMISPVLGITFINGGGRIPKGYKRFKTSLQKNQVQVPIHTTILTGSNDPTNKDHLSLLREKYPEIRMVNVENQGHQLSHDVIQNHIKAFLQTKP